MKRGICNHCRSKVALEFDRIFGRDVLATHARPWKWDPGTCEGSGMPMFTPLPDEHAGLSGVGAAGTAPCGHPGEHVTRNYVRCLRGCDCMHRRKYAAPDGRTSCEDCGKVLRW